ncbi:MAG: hypothetical protein WC734_00550 [Patescibacteria group bacterium]|jgi:hypothetical protein
MAHRAVAGRYYAHATAKHHPQPHISAVPDGVYEVAVDTLVDPDGTIVRAHTRPSAVVPVAVLDKAMSMVGSLEMMGEIPTEHECHDWETAQDDVRDVTAKPRQFGRRVSHHEMIVVIVCASKGKLEEIHYDNPPHHPVAI